MKILKIFFILLVPAMGIVGCKKSDIKPANPATPTANVMVTEPAVTQDNAINGAAASRSMANPIIETDDDKPTTIVGSGDDDREGGDKKKKTVK